MHPTNTWMGPPLDLLQSPQVKIYVLTHNLDPTTRFFTKITSNAQSRKQQKEEEEEEERVYVALQ
jgi:hypothetical protein